MEYLARENLQSLFDRLVELGFEVVGPRVDQGAIVYDHLRTASELPRGWSDQQAPGHYRLVANDNEEELFGFSVGPHSWKKFLFPPLLAVMRSTRDERGWAMADVPTEPIKYACVGVRACELAAIAVQDRVFMSEQYVDPVYAQRRQNLLLIAVNCTRAAATCFCTSMGTGPRCTAGFDLALTELASGFLVETGSMAGQELAASLPLVAATEQQCQQGESLRQRAVEQISKRMETRDLRDKLLSRLTHPRWDDVAQRCLSCANCTLVCPTCFCSSVDEVSDLTNDQVVRQRRWDSCFNFDFSHVGQGPVRDQIRSRYRQWLTHKLASWIDQFGTSGCVGCGRCITWCPVAIDITEEVAALCADPS
jgi:ferredoxin